MSEQLTAKDEREIFNRDIAPGLAEKIGIPQRADDAHRSKRFAYFQNEDQFVIVAGPQEKSNVDLALAHGLTQRGQRKLVLVLPQGYEFPTLQRSAWLRPDAQPQVLIHSGSHTAMGPTPTTVAIPSTAETLRRLTEHLGNKSPHEELAAAATPAHLRSASVSVFDLVEWATTNPLLDPGHRQGERSWHHMGQRVLSIKSTTRGLAVRAGIHTTATTDDSPIIEVGKEPLSAAQFTSLQDCVDHAIEARRSTNGEYHKPDEHWLQAVIRNTPELVGVEQPALREVPAWRPSASGPEKSWWGRGFIDVVGVDGHGDIRVVETKLASNTDDLLIFQGLDYYIWALTYQEALRSRLGASKHARIIIHYVLGATPTPPDSNTPEADVHVSSYLRAQVDALSVEVPWRFQLVNNWFGDRAPKSELLAEGSFPNS